MFESLDPVELGTLARICNIKVRQGVETGESLRAPGPANLTYVAVNNEESLGWRDDSG